MLTIRTIRSDEGLLLKEITLRSVEESPFAFGGCETFAEEKGRPDSYWHQLASELAGDVPEWRDRCIGFVAMEGETVRGKAFCNLNDRVARRAHLVGVWVDPRHRRQGLGRRLLQVACEWAAAKGADHLRLWVDDANPNGVGFYRSLGFSPTGQCRPVSPGSADSESGFEIALPVDLKRIPSDLTERAAPLWG